MKTWKEKVLVIQSYPALRDPMDCSLPGISVHGILQARILEWVAMPFSRGSSWPQDWSQVPHISLPSELPEKPFTSHSLQKTLLSFILSERIKVKKKKSEWVFFFLSALDYENSFYLANLLQEPKGPPGLPDHTLRIANLEQCYLVDNNNVKNPVNWILTVL